MTLRPAVSISRREKKSVPSLSENCTVQGYLAHLEYRGTSLISEIRDGAGLIWKIPRWTGPYLEHTEMDRALYRCTSLIWNTGAPRSFEFQGYLAHLEYRGTSLIWNTGVPRSFPVKASRKGKDFTGQETLTYRSSAGRKGKNLKVSSHSVRTRFWSWLSYCVPNCSIAAL